MSRSPYDLRVSSEAARGLDRLPPKVATAVVEFITSALLLNPQRASKSLRGELTGFRVARRGDYRVLLRIHESPNIVEVVRIAHRADAYRGLQSADPPKNESP
ncbi:MAG: mRNA interferase RelE/StbE [Actinomycetota bacterium]|nr:mRNA interferase RelE/StbE [Actinomycetota bacterium]